MKLEVIESVEPAGGDDIHGPALSTVAAGRAALRYEFLATKSDAAVPSVTGFDMDSGLIDKHSSVHPERSEGSPVAQRFCSALERTVANRSIRGSRDATADPSLRSGSTRD